MAKAKVELELPGPGEDELTANLTFVNNSPYGYSFWLEALNDLNQTLGTSEAFNVDPGTLFDGSITMTIDTSLWTGSGSLLVHLSLGSVVLDVEVARY